MAIARRELLRGAVAAAFSAGLAVEGAWRAGAAVPRPVLREGSRGPAVVTLQARLATLGYWAGSVDGSFGDLTRQAVLAVQKASGLVRDGVVGPETWSRLDAGVRPGARSRVGHVLEIAKGTQLLLVVDGGRVSRIFNTSTGSGQWYFQGGTWHVASTPTGSYRVFRQVDAWDDGPLGRLYRPKYFNEGIAVHGYPSVPAFPASHGCVRLSLPAMDLLWRPGGLAVGGPVLVY